MIKLAEYSGYMRQLIAVEVNRLKKQIALSGTSLTFMRDVLNEYNEPTGESIEIATISGVYHDTFNNHVVRNLHDGATIYRTFEPMFLCLKDEAGLLNIDDYAIIDDIKYRVNDLKDVNNLGYAIDISFEVYNS